MKNVGLFLFSFFLNFIFLFQTIAQEATAAQETVESDTPVDSVTRPVRTYPEDSWFQRALDGQVSDPEFINYLDDVLLHHETGEEVWEDALNALIYVKRREQSDTEAAAKLQERVYQSFAAVISDIDRTKGQRYDVLTIIATSGSTSAVRILKEFVQTPPSIDDPAVADQIDWHEEIELRKDALGFLEDIDTDSALQALHDVVLSESLGTLDRHVDIELKEKALDSLEDREAYAYVQQLAVNPLVVSAMRSVAFEILVKLEDPQYMRAIALIPSAGYEMRSDAIEELAERKATRLIREIAVDPFVDNPIQERAFLKIIASRKMRQDRRDGN